MKNLDPNDPKRLDGLTQQQLIEEIGQVATQYLKEVPSNVPGGSVRDATRVVLDLGRACERPLAAWIKNTGAAETWTSPTGRFIILEQLP
jgi:hypothetical protein